jgi:4-amino-4-deoxy-L-arabinose transferase-like glycosyltransferase
MQPPVVERQPHVLIDPAKTMPRRGLPTWLVALALAIVALAPRCLGLADFFTIDEPYHWIARVRLFAEALREGHWSATDLTGHPGVTTMWLGALGRRLGQLAGVRDLGGVGAGAAYLATLRLPLAMVNSFAVVAGYLVLRRLVRPGVALLAGLLWATSPFLIAHSRLLHLDALLTSFMTLSLLLLLAATVDRTPPSASTRGGVNGLVSGRWSVVGSGACAGLALLTKAPSLALLPLAGLLLFALAPGEARTTKDEAARQSFVVRHVSFGWWRLRMILPLYLLWLGCAALVVVLLWPAMWVTPLGAIGDVLHEITANGGAPEPAGNFFLGRPVAAPGWLFYPAVLLWRSTPLTLLGLLGLALRQPTTDPSSLRDDRTDCWSGEPRVLLALLGFVLLFSTMMSIEPKKFDRYLLPIWPSLEILAAAGLISLVQRIQAFWRQRTTSPAVSFVLWSLFSVLLIGNLAWYHPYYLAYFNPLLGGGATAQQVMLVGWGEGQEQIGAWLRGRPDLKRGPVLSWIPPTLAPFVPASPGVLDLRVPLLTQPSSYAVLYSRSVQRKESAVAEAYVRQTPPLYTLRMYGIDYASVYQLPRPFTEPLEALFGDGLHLRGFSQTRSGNTLLITPSWDIQTSQPAGRFCFVHVLAADGRRVAQLDAPLDQGMFTTWQAGQQFDNPLPVRLPANLPPGEYRVVLGVYIPGGERLPLKQGAALPPEADGPHTLLLTTLKSP